MNATEKELYKKEKAIRYSSFDSNLSAVKKKCQPDAFRYIELIMQSSLWHSVFLPALRLEVDNSDLEYWTLDDVIRITAPMIVGILNAFDFSRIKHVVR